MEANKLGLCELSLDDQHATTGGGLGESGFVVTSLAFLAGALAAPELLGLAVLAGAGAPPIA